MTSLAPRAPAEGVACFRKRMGYAFARELGLPPAARRAEPPARRRYPHLA